MIHRKFTESFPWARYSKKLCKKIENPRHVGFFSEDEAKQRGMRLVVGSQGEAKKGNLVYLYWLVDEMDGVIADAKFQVLGQSALIGAAEAVCELLIRKNYDQASRITADFIDQHLCDSTETHAFPEETFAHLNLVIDAIDMAKQQCLDIPFAEAYLSTPLEAHSLSGEGYPGFAELTREQQITIIEQVIESDIRPYIELDAGGIQILDFTAEKQLSIAYQGACTSCYSATGSTLNAIQEILRNKVDGDITVIPDPSFLTAGQLSF